MSLRPPSDPVSSDHRQLIAAFPSCTTSEVPRSMADPKLPYTRRIRHQNSTKRNEWLAADQKETRKSVTLLALVVALLITGIWLIVTGLSR